MNCFQYYERHPWDYPNITHLGGIKLVPVRSFRIISTSSSFSTSPSLATHQKEVPQFVHQRGLACFYPPFLLGPQYLLLDLIALTIDPLGFWKVGAAKYGLFKVWTGTLLCMTGERIKSSPIFE